MNIKFKMIHIWVLSCMTMVFAWQETSAQCTAAFSDTINQSAKTVYFLNASSGTGLYYFWKFGDNTYSSQQNPVKTYAANGSYNVCLKVYNASSCIDSICKTVVVSGPTIPCISDFSLYPYIPNPKTRYFVSAASGSNLIYTWTFGDTAAPVHTTNAGHTFATFGTYQVCLTVVNSLDTNCRSTKCMNVSIIDTAACTANFVAKMDSLNYLHYSFTPVLNAGAGISYSWSFGDSSFSNSQIGNHLFLPGTYTVCLNTTKITGTDTCRNSHCSILYVGCKSDFTATMSGSSPRIFNFLAKAGGQNLRYYWNFGNGVTYYSGTNASYNYTYPQQGTYTACLTVKGFPDTTCTDTKCKTVVVNDSLNCNAYFTFVSDSTNHHYTFTPYAPNLGNTLYSWRFSDSTTASTYQTNHYFSNNSAYACLKITRIYQGDTCIKEYCTSFQPGCKSDFSYSIDATNSLRVNFNNTSSGKNLTYSWSFGSGPNSTLKNPFKIYDTAGTYTVCLLVKSNSDSTCNSLKCKSITIAPKPHCLSAFAIVRDTINPLKIYFLNLSEGDSLTYYWSFGDGSSPSTSMYPDHLYANPGKYRVCLYVSRSGCNSYFCDSISVGPGFNLCKASFVFSVDSVNGNLLLNNTSTGNHLGSAWSFGDSTFSTDFQPAAHAYGGHGIYNVCLFVADSLDSNCNDLKCQLVSIPMHTGLALGGIDLQRLNIFPIPFSEQLTLSIESYQKQELKLEIFNLEGQRILQQVNTLSYGSNRIILQTVEMPKGVYFLHLLIGDQQVNKRLIK